MSNIDYYENLAVEEEQDETPYVEFDISVSPSDLTLELLAQQVAREDIITPFYQRKFVWKIEQSSKLIESFLMGLPVPQIFLYVNDNNQLELIDGQQRVKSVCYFFEGYFGEPDNKGRREEFRLKGLSQRSEYNGKKFSDLTSRDQRRLRNSTLRAINIKQITPNKSNDSVFHIFERLNTGGTQLKPQEVRNAVYRGPIVTELTKLNENRDWQSILGLRRPDKSQKDVELVLRLFALFQNWDLYEKPMLRYLNNEMRSNRQFDTEEAGEFKRQFPRVCRLVNNTLERPFRPNRVINTASLEAVFITLLENPSIDAGRLDRNYDALMRDPVFIDNIRGGTTDTTVLQTRIQRAKDIL